MSFGQLEDFETLIKYGEGNYWPHLDKIMAVMIRPAIKAGSKFVIEEYNDKSVEKRAEFLKNTLSVSDIWGITLFFYHIVQDYLNRIITTFLKKVQDLVTNEQKSLEMFGVGSQ